MPRPSAYFYQAPRSGVAAQPNGFTLHVPRGDQRLKSRKSKAVARRGHLIVAICGACVAVAAAMAIYVPEFRIREAQVDLRQLGSRALVAAGFGIDQVSLKGHRYTLDQDVYDALDLPNVKTFAALDTQAALRRIERISWVDTAQITRVFPGTLTVEISERVPAAIWNRGNNSYLIDATGRTLGPVPPNMGWVLPQLSGEGANNEAPVLFAAISSHKEIEAQFGRAERIAERRWSIVLKNGSRIELGADREFEGLDQVASISVLRQALAATPVIVDVRTAGRSVIRPLTSSASLTFPATRVNLVQSP